MTMNPKIEKEWEILIRQLDLGKALREAAETIEIIESFPPIYFEGEEKPKRFGFSGEEI